MKIAEVSVGNLKIISLGACQMTHLHASKRLLTSPCTAGTGGWGVGNHYFNPIFHWKTYIHAHISTIQFCLKKAHLTSLWISLLNC